MATKEQPAPMAPGPYCPAVYDNNPSLAHDWRPLSLGRWECRRCESQRDVTGHVHAADCMCEGCCAFCRVCVGLCRGGH